MGLSPLPAAARSSSGTRFLCRIATSPSTAAARQSSSAAATRTGSSTSVQVPPSSCTRSRLPAGNAGSNGGGAIMSAGHLTITNSALLSNTAAYGGALEIYNGSALIQNTTFAGNQALDPALDTGGGGAINQYFNFGDGNNNPNENPNVVIQNSTFAYNYAASAGREGIWQENGKLQLRYNVIAHNGTGNCRDRCPQQVDPVLCHGQPRRRRHLLAGGAGRPRPLAAGLLWCEHADVCAAAQQSRHRRRARRSMRWHRRPAQRDPPARRQPRRHGRMRLGRL